MMLGFWWLFVVAAVGLVEGNDLSPPPPSGVLCTTCTTCQNPCATPPPQAQPPPPEFILPPPPPPALILPPPPPPALILPSPPPPASIGNKCPPPPSSGSSPCSSGCGGGTNPAPYRYIFPTPPGYNSNFSYLYGGAASSQLLRRQSCLLNVFLVPFLQLFFKIY